MKQSQSGDTSLRRHARSWLTAGLLLLAPLVAGAGTATNPSGMVYSADESGHDISRVDVASGSSTTMPVDIMPHNVQYVPASGVLLVVGMPMGGAMHGGGHADGMHAMPAMKGRLLVFDTNHPESDPVVVTVGAHPAHVIADPDGDRAYVTNAGDDTVSVVDLDAGKVVATIPVGDYPHGLRMSADGQWIYVANRDDDSVSVVSVAEVAEVARIPVGDGPVQVAVTPDGKRVYVTLGGVGKVAVIDTDSRKVADRVAVGQAPAQLHVTPDGRFVYVANQGAEADSRGTVSVIDVTGNNVVETIATGRGTHGVTVSGDGQFVYVTNTLDDTVSAIAVARQSVVATWPVGDAPRGITWRAD